MAPGVHFRGSMSGRVVLALALVAAAIPGCSPLLRDIPTHTLGPRSSSVVERDTRQCENAITGHVKGPWLPSELEFAACMIARNYQTFVQVLDAPLEVRKASLSKKVTPARVLADLVECERIVEGHVSVIEMIGRPAAAVAGFIFWPISVGTSMVTPAFAIQRQRDYTACMKPRGYLVTLWKAEPSPPPPRAREGP